MPAVKEPEPLGGSAPVPGRFLDRILAEGAPPPADGSAEPTAAAETSERILAAAAEQVEDFGLRRFTIDDVARRLRMSRVTIYRYFPKRDRLVEAVLLREMHRFFEQLGRAIEPCATLEERLVEGVVFALGYLRGHKLLNRVLRTEPELLLPALTLRAGPVLTTGREFIAGFARAEADQGNLALSAAEIDAISELLARLVLSFLLTPESVLGMRSDEEVRRFAEHYLAPTLQALTGLPDPSSR